MGIISVAESLGGATLVMIVGFLMNGLGNNMLFIGIGVIFMSLLILTTITVGKLRTPREPNKDEDVESSDSE